MRYVVKNERGEYASYNSFHDEWEWLGKRYMYSTTCRGAAFQVANDVGGKVYRLRKPSVKRERRQAVGYIRSLGGTRMFQACSAALHTAAGGIERGEHLAWRQPKEAK